MVIKKAYKIRLYPTQKQEQQLLQISGAVRFVWNYYLDKRKHEYLENKKTLSRFDSIKDLTQLKKQPGYHWLKDIKAKTLEQSVINLDKAYSNFFEKRKNFPLFKSKDEKQSFCLSNQFVLKKRKMLIKRGCIIKFRGTTIPEGSMLKCATVTRDTLGNWYASISASEEIYSKNKTGSPIGIDLGLTHLAITSEGKKYENLKPRKKIKKKMKFLQQSMDRKKGGSKRREKAKLLVAKLHKKIANQRMNHLHQTSHRITSENQALIVCEDLAVKNMVKNHKLAHAISDTGWAEFVRQLEYKQVWRGGEFIKIDRFFPSSKTCSNCGYIVEKLPLSIREWICLSCQAKHDRDINAAKMILQQGLRNSRYAESTDGKQSAMVA